MDVPEELTHSFIIRFWFEEVDQETGRVVWRGYITHVMSGERRALRALDGIVEFIAGYLQQES